jgi:hypothetical protein
MYTTTRHGRTGYGNRAYASNTAHLDIPRISGWLLIGIALLSIFFLAIALTRRNGFAQSWQMVLALTLTETVADAVKQALVNLASEVL